MLNEQEKLVVQDIKAKQRQLIDKEEELWAQTIMFQMLCEHHEGHQPNATGHNCEHCGCPLDLLGVGVERRERNRQ